MLIYFGHLLHLLVCTDTEKTLMPKVVQPQKYFKIAAVACSKSQAKQMPTRKGMLHYAGAQQCALQQT